MTVNPVAKLDCYPVPKVKDLFATLSHGKLFTKLDLRQAYQQLLLEDESKKYVVNYQHHQRLVPIHEIAIQDFISPWHFSERDGALAAKNSRRICLPG